MPGTLGPGLPVPAARIAIDRPKRSRRRPWQVGDEVGNSRRRSDAAELRAMLHELVAGLPWLSAGTPDPALVGIAAELGLRPWELAFAGAVTGKTVTLVGVPDEVWNNPARRRDLARLRIRARRAGCRALIVPWCVAVREPRRGNACMAAAALRKGASERSRAWVLERVAGGSAGTLAEVAAIADCEDPAGAALHLLGSGALRTVRPLSSDPVGTVRLARPAGARRLP